MMGEIKKIPSSADLLNDTIKRKKSALQKTRGITADMVAVAEVTLRSNPATPSRLSSTNHRKKTEKLPPSNYIG